MIGIFAAMMAATGWGFDAIVVRLGLRRVHPTVGMMFSLPSGLLAVTAISLAVEPGGLARHAANGGVWWFALVGLVNFLIGRQCNFHATHRLGAARAASIFATSPLISVVLAAVAVGEQVTAPMLAGTALIVAGVTLVVTSS